MGIENATSTIDLLNNLQSNPYLPYILALTLLSVPIKGFALWKAARLSHKWYFMAILVINSLAILDLFYILVVARKYTVDVSEEHQADITGE